MTIFNKCHAVFVGFLAFITVTTVGYTINQGDFFQNEYLFIITKTFWISLSVAYAKWFDMVSLRRLTKKEILLLPLSSLSCMLLMMFLRLSIIYLEVSCWALLIKRVKIYRCLF